jgi:hypothetical protein
MDQNAESKRKGRNNKEKWIRRTKAKEKAERKYKNCRKD